MDLCLVDGSDAAGKAIEWTDGQIAAERIAVELHLGEVAGRHQLLHLPAVVGELPAYAAEFVVAELQHAREAAEVAKVHLGNLDSALVSGVVVHVGPGVLQHGPHLHLEAYLVQLRMLGNEIRRLGDAADIMKRQVAEAVGLVRLALVHRIGPVDGEEALQHGRHLVHVVNVEGDDAQAHQVGYVVNVAVLPALELKLAGKRRLRLDALLHRRHHQPGLGEEFLQLFGNDLRHLGINRQEAAVLLEQFF